MAVGGALRIGSQVIKHAPKVTKLKKLGPLQKILSKVKSSSNVIQSKLKTKQNLAQISEKIGNARNVITQNSAIRKMDSSISKTVRTNPTVLKNIRSLKNSKELGNYLKTYFSGGKPKVLPPNASKFAKLRLGPLSSKIFFGLELGERLYDDFRWDAPEVREIGNIGTSIMSPIAGGQSDNSITNELRNLATNIKHIGNRKKYQRTKLAGASMLKIDKTILNPFDNKYVMVPNQAMKHNIRVDRKLKWDAREKRKNEAK